MHQAIALLSLLFLLGSLPAQAVPNLATWEVKPRHTARSFCSSSFCGTDGGPDLPSPSMERTFYVKGARQRLEESSDGSLRTTILQCDLGKKISIDPSGKTFTIAPVFN